MKSVIRIEFIRDPYDVFRKVRMSEYGLAMFRITFFFFCRQREAYVRLIDRLTLTLNLHVFNSKKPKHTHLSFFNIAARYPNKVVSTSVGPSVPINQRLSPRSVASAAMSLRSVAIISSGE